MVSISFALRRVEVSARGLMLLVGVSSLSGWSPPLMYVPPLVTFVGLILIQILGGAVIIESLFALPGLGRLLLSSIETRDYPVVQGALVIVVVIAMATSLAGKARQMIGTYRFLRENTRQFGLLSPAMRWLAMPSSPFPEHVMPRKCGVTTQSLQEGAGARRQA